MGVKDHKKKCPSSLDCAVVTVSDSCSSGNGVDTSGPIIVSLLKEKNNVIYSSIIPDERSRIASEILALSDSADCIVVTGGTGLSQRDVTIEAVSPLFEKELPGFGELFRSLSYEEIGSASIMSRAVAGIFNKTAVFCIPGSNAAVRLAMTIISSEMYHIIKHVRD